MLNTSLNHKQEAYFKMCFVFLTCLRRSYIYQIPPYIISYFKVLNLHAFHVFGNLVTMVTQ